MNKELLEQLKKAGFPWTMGINFEGGFYDVGWEPSLDKLIEECPKEDFALMYSDNLWEAGYWGIDSWEIWEINGETENKMVAGKTPKEAVARLYIELKNNI